MRLGNFSLGDIKNLYEQHIEKVKEWLAKYPFNPIKPIENSEVVISENNQNLNEIISKFTPEERAYAKKCWIKKFIEDNHSQIKFEDI